VIGGLVQVTTSGLSLLFSPYVLRQVGAEAYGLVGIFLIAFAWFSLLDVGLTPALMREAARYNGGAVTRRCFAHCYRGLEGLITFFVLPLGLLAWFGASAAADHWFQLETLSRETVTQTFYLISAILLIRWLSGTQNAVLAGFERHLTLHMIALASAILRFPCIVIWFQLVEPTAISYFTWQLIVSALELAAFFILARKTFKPPKGITLLDAARSLRYLLSFASQQAVVSILSIVIIQTDKIILSSLLPLATFGYLTLAIAAAAGVNLIAIPVNQILMPRLTQLLAMKKDQEAYSLYRLATRGTMVVIAAISGSFALFSYEVMYAWTGDVETAELTAPALTGYAVGNAGLAATRFCYYLQYAHGKLRLHTIGLSILILTLIPFLYMATLHYGIRGAATVWAISWLIFLLTWTTWSHRFFLKDEWLQWLLNDVLRPVLAVAVVGGLIRWHDYWPDTRHAVVVVLGIKGMVLLLTAALAAGFYGSRTSSYFSKA